VRNSCRRHLDDLTQGVQRGLSWDLAAALRVIGFFRDVLRIHAVRRPPTPFAVDPASIGSRVHDVLREVYARLLDEQAFTASDPGARLPRILRKSDSAAV